MLAGKHLIDCNHSIAGQLVTETLFSVMEAIFTLVCLLYLLLAFDFFFGFKKWRESANSKELNKSSSWKENRRPRRTRRVSRTMMLINRGLKSWKHLDKHKYWRFRCQDKPNEWYFQNHSHLREADLKTNETFASIWILVLGPKTPLTEKEGCL